MNLGLDRYIDVSPSSILHAQETAGPVPSLFEFEETTACQAARFIPCGGRARPISPETARPISPKTARPSPRKQLGVPLVKQPGPSSVKELGLSLVKQLAHPSLSHPICGSRGPQYLPRWEFSYPSVLWYVVLNI